MRPPHLSRRELLALASTGVMGASLWPGRAFADDPLGRKFLFLYARGGWDPTFVFQPAASAAYQPNESTLAEAGGIPFVDAPFRPSVRRFFEAWGHRACVINGFEVRSVTHERCARILLTGRSQADADDWPAILAGESSGFMLPGLVVHGPSYTARHTSAVMRLGNVGQLSTLLDGSALSWSDQQTRPLSDASAAAVDAFVAARSQDYAAAAGPGQQTRFAQDQATSMERLALVRSMEGDLDLSVGLGDDWLFVPERIEPALTCLELGLTRCAMVEHAGLWDVGWDTHTGIEDQSDHFELLFADLMVILGMLGDRSGPQGGTLLDETVVVVISEMGRTPTLNPVGGKDHWTMTSALMLGPGVVGGRVIGAYDDDFVGQPTDLASGEPAEGGALMTAAHLGATLLALGDVDPAEYTTAEPITAALE